MLKSLVKMLLQSQLFGEYKYLKRYKILIGEVEKYDLSEEFAHEKLSPVLAMYHAKTFDEAFAKADCLIADGGYGHTSSILLIK